MDTDESFNVQFGRKDISKVLCVFLFLDFVIRWCTSEGPEYVCCLFLATSWRYVRHR